MTVRDPRLHAVRPDLADARLKGQVEAARFVEGQPARIAVPIANLRRKPDRHAGLDTQLLLGEDVEVFDMCEGWAWVQRRRDGYVGYVNVGYVNVGSLGEVGPAATHVVAVPRSFVYPGADLRLAQDEALSMGSTVRVEGEAETRGTRYALLSGGRAMIAGHLRPLDQLFTDYVDVAQSFLNTPYLWGGNSGFGIDCSGLVQLAMQMCGTTVLRDTDMQESTIGTLLDTGQNHAGVQRGDLVFWKGHVAIMADAETMIHANGHTMLVSHERLDDAVKRIGYLYGPPTSFRRP